MPAVRYDRRHGHVVVALHNGVELASPVGLVEGLAGAAPDDLADIEIEPAGLGLHWPKLDADVYVPALMQGVFWSRRWMAAQLGATGGKATSKTKADAAHARHRRPDRLTTISEYQPDAMGIHGIEPTDGIRQFQATARPDHHPASSLCPGDLPWTAGVPLIRTTR